MRVGRPYSLQPGDDQRERRGEAGDGADYSGGDGLQDELSVLCVTRAGVTPSYGVNTACNCSHDDARTYTGISSIGTDRETTCSPAKDWPVHASTHSPLGR